MVRGKQILPVRQRSPKELNEHKRRKKAYTFAGVVQHYVAEEFENSSVQLPVASSPRLTQNPDQSVCMLSQNQGGEIS